ncbi:MAG: protein tyrosine phosphatase family protein [Gammaproteobacteria bacterium]|nr:protein tyrosine phosphatase family protein [Gammaproteobacteria bacterium]
MNNDLLDDIYNYQPVNDMLATSGQPTEAQLKIIANAGFQVVINLALHNDQRYSLRDEAGSVNGLGMEYIHIPVAWEHPLGSDLQQFFAAMKRSAGKKIFLHCAANMRASAFLGLYRVLEQGMPPDQAFDIMQLIWEPNAVWSGFIDQMLARVSNAS